MKATALFMLLVLAGLVVTGCSSVPITKDTIGGRYTVRGHGWYAYETITLHDDSFEWHYVTDALPGPGPISGRFSLDGRRLTFDRPQMQQPSRIITHRRGTFLMWTPWQYEEYLRTGKTPVDVLYRTR